MKDKMAMLRRKWYQKPINRFSDYFNSLPLQISFFLAPWTMHMLISNDVKLHGKWDMENCILVTCCNHEASFSRWALAKPRSVHYLSVISKFWIYTSFQWGSSENILLSPLHFMLPTILQHSHTPLSGDAYSCLLVGCRAVTYSMYT